MNLITTIKNKILGIKNKTVSLNNDINSLESSISKLQEISETNSYQVVEGLAVEDRGGEISYRMEGDIYQYLLEIWKRSIIPVLKIELIEKGKKSYIYLPCSKQRWKVNGTYEDAFITDSYLNIFLYESKLILDAYHNLYYITGNRYTKKTVINNSESDCYEDSSSSN